MGPTDFIGGRGEAIAFAHLARICREFRQVPFFWPCYLGEKAETFDYYVELVDAGAITPYFFVQVKTTTKLLTRTQEPPRLRIEVPASDLQRMLRHPAPTYIVGIDERTDRAYIVVVFGGMTEAISSITTAHELTVSTLKCLWDEVLDFWQGRDMVRVASAFTN
jgi:hypothetical protein